MYSGIQSSQAPNLVGSKVPFHHQTLSQSQISYLMERRTRRSKFFTHALIGACTSVFWPSKLLTWIKKKRCISRTLKLYQRKAAGPLHHEVISFFNLKVHEGLRVAGRAHPQPHQDDLGLEIVRWLRPNLLEAHKSREPQRYIVWFVWVHACFSVRSHQATPFKFIRLRVNA